MADRDFPDGRMLKLMGKPWSSWNLPDQPTESDLCKLRDAYQPPEQHRNPSESVPLPSQYMSLFGTHPDTDFLSIIKCPGCGWLMKIQHAQKHYLRDSRGSIVCRANDIAIFGSKVLGKPVYPLGEIKETYSKKVTLRIPQTSPTLSKSSSHGLRTSTLNDLSSSSSSSKSRSSSHSSKTDYVSHSTSSQYRSRSHSQQVHHPPSSSYMPKSRSGSTMSSSSHSSQSITSSSTKGKSGRSSHSTSTSSSTSSSWSTLRSSSTSKSASNTHHKHGNSGSYTLSIPCEDMGQNESVEDLLMSNIGPSYTTSKHTVHIIATSNTSKSKSSEPDYDHIKFYSDVPEKRQKLDGSSSSSHSRGSDHHNKLSHDSHHDSYSKTKSKSSSSSMINGSLSNYGLSGGDTGKKSKASASSSSGSVHSKNDLGSSSAKHHLRSTTPSSTSSTSTSISKPLVVVQSVSSGQSNRHHVGVNSSSTTDKDKDKDRVSSPKKKKRKRDKDEPRKIIPLKDRDFNPDKHCGVCSPGSNLPCKRSLTCKTHSVSSRRNVVGRNKSFDELLAAHKLAKTEEKNSKVKEVVQEVIAVKPKKKKPSGSSSSLAAVPNEGTTLAVLSERPSAMPTSPQVAVGEVTPATAPRTRAPSVSSHHVDLGKPIVNIRPPLAFPYQQEDQAKFEKCWYNPLAVRKMTDDEQKKITFYLRHYNNLRFIACDVPKPAVKNTREKSNLVREL